MRKWLNLILTLIWKKSGSLLLISFGLKEFGATKSQKVIVWILTTCQNCCLAHGVSKFAELKQSKTKPLILIWSETVQDPSYLISGPHLLQVNPTLEWLLGVPEDIWGWPKADPERNCSWHKFQPFQHTRTRLSFLNPEAD